MSIILWTGTSVSLRFWFKSLMWHYDLFSESHYSSRICSISMHVKVSVVSPRASEINIRSQYMLNQLFVGTTTTKNVPLAYNKEVQMWWEKVCPLSQYSSKKCYSCCIPSELFENNTSLKVANTCRGVPASLLVLQEEKGEEGRLHNESRTVVGSITSLIKWRHSEKCFSLVAAIYFLVLICALWQGFVRGNNEQLYNPPSPQLL